MVLLLLPGCGKVKEESINSKGQASAKINGNPWKAAVWVMNKGEKFNILLEKMQKLEQDWVPQEAISLLLIDKRLDSVQNLFIRDSVVSTAPGTATKGYGSFYTRAENWDVLCDFYDVIEVDSLNNWVKIDSQQEGFKEVRGSFEMKLFRTKICDDTKYPDTLHITDGRFHFKL